MVVPGICSLPDLSTPPTQQDGINGPCETRRVLTLPLNINSLCVRPKQSVCNLRLKRRRYCYVKDITRLPWRHGIPTKLNMLKVCMITLLCLSYGVLSAVAAYDVNEYRPEEEIATDDPRIQRILASLTERLTEGFTISIVKATLQVCSFHYHRKRR